MPPIPSPRRPRARLPPRQLNTVALEAELDYAERNWPGGSKRKERLAERYDRHRLGDMKAFDSDMKAFDSEPHYWEKQAYQHEGKNAYMEEFAIASDCL